MSITFLKQTEAQKIDEELFTEFAFSVDQLMELAGFSCAVAVAKAYPIEKLPQASGSILVCCGPGNNGGDGLVCARHLKMFGYKPSVFYARTPSKQLYKNLVRQCEKMDIPVLSTIPITQGQKTHSFDLLIDALFGFGFKPPASPEYQTILSLIAQANLPVISIDVPSGWNVEEGPGNDPNALRPDCLISLTAPKQCARFFKGRFHFLGGRFVPDELATKYKLNLPPYPGCEPCVLLSQSE